MIGESGLAIRKSCGASLAALHVWIASQQCERLRTTAVTNPDSRLPNPLHSRIAVMPPHHALLVALPVALLGGIALVVILLALARAISSLTLLLLQYSAVGTRV